MEHNIKDLFRYRKNAIIMNIKITYKASQSSQKS